MFNWFRVTDDGGGGGSERGERNVEHPTSNVEPRTEGNPESESRTFTRPFRGSKLKVAQDFILQTGGEGQRLGRTTCRLKVCDTVPQTRGTLRLRAGLDHWRPPGESVIVASCFFGLIQRGFR